MNKIIINLTGFVLLSFSTVFGCTGTTGLNPSPPVNLENSQNKIKTFPDTETNITVGSGDEFIIKLDSNATTGFKWDLSNNPDTSVVQKINSEYIPPANPLPGTGSYELWKFKALKKGNTEIKMKYYRSFEKDVPPAKEITFKINVQ